MFRAGAGGTRRTRGRLPPADAAGAIAVLATAVYHVSRGLRHFGVSALDVAGAEHGRAD